MPRQINAAELASLKTGAKPVLVTFSAAWCGPCRQQSVVLDDVARLLGDDAEVTKVDIEAESDLAYEHDVRSIPTLLLFQGGQLVERFHGLTARDRLLDALRAA